MKNLISTTILCCIANLLFSQNSDSAQYYFQKGLENIDKRLYAVAGKNFDKAIQFNPNFVEAYI
ncbi:MAG TPA: hypothetical protein VIL78_19715, partial [Hanamia sp.]